MVKISEIRDIRDRPIPREFREIIERYLYIYENTKFRSKTIENEIKKIYDNYLEISKEAKYGKKAYIENQLQRLEEYVNFMEKTVPCIREIHEYTVKEWEKFRDNLVNFVTIAETEQAVNKDISRELISQMQVILNKEKGEVKDITKRIITEPRNSPSLTWVISGKDIFSIVDRYFNKMIKNFLTCQRFEEEIMKILKSINKDEDVIQEIEILRENLDSFYKLKIMVSKKGY